MYRSASWSRVSEDQYFMHGSSPSPNEPQSGLRRTPSSENNELPLYDPIAELAKKERARVKFAENAVHLIPLVLFLCAITLWFFSNPDVDVGFKADMARIEGLTLDGEFDNDSDGTQTGVLPLIDLWDDHQVSNKSAKRFK
ncbi:uncharacterized protein LOC132190684 [Corylus avellana]|uniref:uncharacterized protein LOC132190678 n=1 Tax=Corylus avellana TaxID=13451 RepID=UPI00286A92EB|nr:uncharacterized protein LOC132190678 [Corylus avellana]XP_059461709.1 uncharacterized protein LOC132190684 [Corylus avellana]